MTVTLVSVKDRLPSGFVRLRDEPRHEGYRHIERLDTDWLDGSHRFAARGEALGFVADRRDGHTHILRPGGD